MRRRISLADALQEQATGTQYAYDARMSRLVFGTVAHTDGSCVAEAQAYVRATSGGQSSAAPLWRPDVAPATLTPWALALRALIMSAHHTEQGPLYMAQSPICA